MVILFISVSCSLTPINFPSTDIRRQMRDAIVFVKFSKTLMAENVNSSYRSILWLLLYISKSQFPLQSSSLEKKKFLRLIFNIAKPPPSHSPYPHRPLQLIWPIFKQGVIPYREGEKLTAQFHQRWHSAFSVLKESGAIQGSLSVIAGSEVIMNGLG
jgi:hypothetical protein